MTSTVRVATPEAAGTPTATAPRPKAPFSWGKWGGYASMAIIIIWCLAPFYWMIVMSFRSPDYATDSTLYPNHFTLSNYKFAFNTTNNHFGRSLVNGVIIGTSVTVIGMLVGVFAAYAMARLQFRGKNLVLGGVLAASMFPGVAILTPLFQLFSDWGWLGTYRALILPQISGALPLAVFVLTSFFTDMPWELEQAARVDGATPGQAFRLVIFPLAAPALFTTAILVFLSVWNEYLLSSVLYNGNDNVAPPTVALAKFTAGPHVIPYTQTMAAGVVITVPLVIVVLLCQRRIVSGLTAGGVKG
jgi:multiple sugar transport system permease protein